LIETENLSKREVKERREPKMKRVFEEEGVLKNKRKISLLHSMS